jgi:hypothetical protein
MNTNELYSELFAYRIMLQDSYENESEIIREIKNYLIEIGITLLDIPNIIHEFYKTYGFEISLDIINQACSNQMVNNFLSFSLSQDDFDDTVFTHTHINPLQNLNHDSSDNSSDEELIDDNPNPNLEYINNNSINQQMMQNIFQYMNLVNGNVQNHWVNNPINHGSLVSVISNLVSNPVLINGQSLQNVVVSMDDKDINKLDSVKLESNLDSNCSICMGNMLKDEMVTNLFCSHTFHTDCIQPYLKEYNYKCPICRTELGKAKYSL